MTLAQLSARVPRYTSYPTAPHFHAGIGAATYERWLRALPCDAPLSLYLHIPFCDTLCWFCGCHTRVVNNYGPVHRYLDLLSAEIEHIGAILGAHRPVSHVHWGGGSPTLLTPADVVRLADLLRGRFEFGSGAEFAIEIDPRGLSDEMVAALAEAGVNRASIGVQDCDETVQRAINRYQPFEVTQDAVERLRFHGIDAINIDLIYGLPHQTVAGLCRTVEEVLTLAPGRLAVFGYAHVPHFKKHQALIDERALPDVGERLAQFEAVQSALSEAGYVAIGIDHFARPGDSMAQARRSGRLARNFQGYTVDNAAALIGFGASSIGALPQGYVQNLADVPAYRRAVEAGALPVARGIALGEEDRLRRAIIERLMCDLAVDLDAIARRHGLSPTVLTPSLQALQPYAADGLVSISDGWVRVPDKARSHVRLIAAAFDQYLGAGAPKHALAV